MDEAKACKVYAYIRPTLNGIAFHAYYLTKYNFLKCENCGNVLSCVVFYTNWWWYRFDSIRFDILCDFLYSNSIHVNIRN